MEEKLSKSLHEVVVKILQGSETVIDEELKKINDACEDENELNRLRQKRIEEMKKDFELKKVYIRLGHGKYDLITDERDFFDVIKRSENVICHFFRPTTLRCEIFDKHLEILSGRHIEARFIKINAEKAPFICTSLDIRVLPTIALVKNSKLVHKIVGFEELSSRDDFTTMQLESLLKMRGLIRNS